VTVEELLDGVAPAPFEALLPGAFLVIAPHPDDESLGCGGLIAEACARGCPPVVAFLTDGAGSHPGSRTHGPAAVAALRREEAAAATRALGVPPARVLHLDAPDGAAPRTGEALAALAARLGTQAPGPFCATLCSWRHDPHGDHEAAWRLASALPWRVLEYPVWGRLLPGETVLPEAGWTGARIEVARHQATRLAAIAAHRSQAGLVITDDPAGFALPAALVAACTGQWDLLLWRE
jgi:LmbE family N-acetylglucosaminyl deacetylase